MPMNLSRQEIQAIHATLRNLFAIEWNIPNFSCSLLGQKLRMSIPGLANIALTTTTIDVMRVVMFLSIAILIMNVLKQLETI